MSSVNNNNIANSAPAIRVGKCVKQAFHYTTPAYPGYISVRVHSMEKNYGELSPYRLCDSRNRTIENLWQFSKVYSYVRRSVQHKGFNKNHVTWDWPSERHYENANPSAPITIRNLEVTRLTYNFWNWRRSGFNAEYAIRYPNTYEGRHEPICALWPTEGLVAEDQWLEFDEKLKAKPHSVVPEYSPDDAPEYQTQGINYDLLDYVSARKRIYCGLYAELVKTHPRFIQLKRELDKNHKLLISEVDGPKYEDVYPYNLVENHSIPFTYDICKHLINDITHPFGHGYTIAALLMGWDDLVTDTEHVTLGRHLNRFTMKPAA